MEQTNQLSLALYVIMPLFEFEEEENQRQYNNKIFYK